MRSTVTTTCRRRIATSPTRSLALCSIVLGCLHSASAQTPPQGASPVSGPLVSAQLWFVTFSPAVKSGDLPLDLRVLERAGLPHGRDANGRLATWGLAMQMEFDKLDVRANGHRLHVRDGALVSEPESPDPPSSPPWEIVTAPRVLVAIGQSASISVGRPIPFLKQQDDLCLAVETDESLFEGVSLTLTATRADEEGVRFERMRLKVSRAVGRQPLEGVPLDVGRPIIDTRETELNNTLAADRIAVIPLPQGDGERPLLVFMTARVLSIP
ncbi:MAG: hypothetical protein HRF50_05365 [Phycisphaerae bacterium]|jgi:hypothetical protein